MINTLLKATIVRRFIQLGIKPVKAMGMADRMKNNIKDNET
jgi:hypothetical protein